MANHMNCPECEHPFGYSAALIGKTIRCRQCQHTFTVKAPPAGTANPGSKPAAPAVTAKQGEKSTPDALTPPALPAKVVENRDEARRTRQREEEDRRRAEKEERERQRKADNRRTRDDDDDDDRPRARRRDDDDDRPRSRPNRYSDDDDDDVPDRRRERGSDKGMLVGILVGSVVLIAVIVGGLAYALWPKGDKKDTALAATNLTTNPPIVNPPVVNPPIVNPPINPPPVRPNPPPVRPNPPPIVDPPMPMPPVAPPPKVVQAKPNGLSEREEIDLGGPAGIIAPGAGGKLLCITVPIKNKVVIFNVAERKIVKEITTEGGILKIAAGRDMLHILNTATLAMERYNLTTFERDASHKFPTARNVFGMGMGSDSDGPLVVVALEQGNIFKSGRLHYVNPKTYADLNVRVQGKNPAFGIGKEDKPVMIYCSNDGKVIVAQGVDHSDPVCDVYDGMRTVVRSVPFAMRDAVKPAADGSVLCGKGCFYNSEFKTNDKPAPFGTTWIIPALDGEYYLTLNKAKDRPFEDENKPMLLDIWNMGSRQPALGVGVLPEILWKGDYGHGRHEAFHNNLFFHSRAKTLTIIAPDDPNRLVTYKVKLD